MFVVLLVIPFAIIIAYEAPDMVRNRLWGELIVFTGIVLLGFTVSLLQVIDVMVPNPINGTKFFTEKVAMLFQFSS